jgi:hypothetical protein
MRFLWSVAPYQSTSLHHRQDVGRDGVSERERMAREALRRAERATSGPWYSSGDAVEWSPKQKSSFDECGAGIATKPGEDCWGGDVVQGGAQDEQGGAVGVLRNDDAEFIAHAREDVPRLARALLEAEAELEACVSERDVVPGHSWKVEKLHADEQFSRLYHEKKSLEHEVQALKERERDVLEAEAKLERLRKELEWLANHPSLPKFVHRGATYGVYLMAGDVQRIRDVVRASPTTEGPEEPGEEEARR